MLHIEPTTTAMDLLRLGASIIGRKDQTISEVLQIDSFDPSWLHDFSLEMILDRGAVMTTMNGLGLVKVRDRVILFEEQYGEIQTLCDYPWTDLGLYAALDDLEAYSETEGLAAVA